MPKATKWPGQLPKFDNPLDFMRFMRSIRNEDTTGDNPPDSSKIAPLPDDTKFRGLPLSVLLDTRNAVTVTPDGRAVPLHSPPLNEHILDIGFDYGSTIGENVTDNSVIKIGIGERRSGLYILGKPRMGKSWLMVNLILQDIERRRGIFFLDPHGDAIDDLINRTTSEVILLDPEKEEYTFGINVLECPDIDNMASRNDTFTKAKGAFDKLWKNTFDEKPWLQMILQNTLYAFIETQGLTLVELPIFYRNPEFRRYVVGNIKYNWQVRDYWNLTFASKSRHDQDEIMEAAQTRAEIMLAHPYVSDIVGQAKTTIDFARVLSEKKIVLVKLSNRMSEETKKIIGTILVSELLHAIEHRPVEERDKQFCIFIDEFQHFASYQDFPVLITQAPKYGVATTLAHHERYGQLSGQPEIMGATAAIANKVLFQITARDAHELAPEFAQAPTTETRYEEGYIISREPVWDLLRWHDNPTIREFVNRYIRPMKERLEDIRGETEAERLIRTEYLDEASMFRISERIEGVERIEANPDRQRGALSSAGRLTASAGGQTRKLLSLSEETASLHLTFRDLNKFLVALMEGSIAPGQDEFCNFLIDRIAGLSSVPKEQNEILEIYVRLAYGAPESTINIPFPFAKKHDLFALTVLRLDAVYKYEYRKRKEQLKEKVHMDHEKYRKRMMENVEGTEWDMPPLNKELENMIRSNKERGEELIRTMDDNEWCGKKWRQELAPAPLSVRINRTDRDKVMVACAKELGATGKKALQIIQEFVDFCNLLAAPQNHITKRSGQFAAKQVNIRTEADMTNEMARNLTNLPKYTAYAKILQDEGARIWTGKIRTLELGATTAGAATGQTIDHVEMRWRVQEEIAERHKRLVGNITGDNEPPPAVY